MDRVPVVSRMLDVIQWVGLAMGVAMIVAMAVLMNVEIAGRTLFGTSTQISDEFAGYLFTAATMLCFVPALREARFLRVEGLVNVSPPRLRAVFEALAAGIGTCTCIILADATWNLTATSLSFGTRSLQASQTPLAIPQAFMPVGFGILALSFLEWGLVRASRLWRGRAVEEAHHAVD